MIKWFASNKDDKVDLYIFLKKNKRIYFVYLNIYFLYAQCYDNFNNKIDYDFYIHEMEEKI